MNGKILIPWIFWLLLSTLCLAQESQPRGAKELFYNPSTREILALPGVSAPRSRQPRVSESNPPRETAQPRTRREVNVDSSDDVGMLGLSYWIELVERPGEAGRSVTESRTFLSGERIRLHFKSNREGLISLFQLGSSGRPSMLFPSATQSLTNNRLRAGQERALPASNAWFRFDGSIGTERLIVVFAASREDFEAIIFDESRQDRVKSSLPRTARRGSKDLVIESETEIQSEIGTYAVNISGQPIVIEIELRHQ